LARSGILKNAAKYLIVQGAVTRHFEKKRSEINADDRTLTPRI
jgi:hypothetical protein